MLLLASANRDAERWGPTADRVDLGRADADEHVAFGGGIHHCLGAALARLEGEVAIGRRINLRGYDSIPLTV